MKNRSRRTRRTLPAAALLASTLLLSGCAITGTPVGTSSSGSASGAAASARGSLDASQVHDIALAIDESALEEMIRTYLDSGEKEWISGSVEIDGRTFENVGIKLKGNSTLRSISVDTPPQDLPLRIRLDKYVDGQQYEGVSDLTVRANSSETSMNEAVALDLLAQAGLASTQAIATRFSVNGGDEELRLTVQNLDETWVEDNFPDAGAESVLYKAEADGDWSWRGEDGDYTSAFDIEAGAEDYAPLIALLDLVDNGTADEITEQLPEMLDIDSLASYLAFEDLIDNFDDIDGPGNNSYLFWDSATGRFTVVAWDHNLAFGDSPGGGGGADAEAGGDDGGAAARGGAAGQNPGGAAPSGEMPAPPGDGEMPEAPGGAETGGGMPGGGRGMSRDNPLVAAFDADEEWAALYRSRLAELTEALVDGGAVQNAVEAWTAALQEGAADLVSEDAIASEAQAILSDIGDSDTAGETPAPAAR